MRRTAREAAPEGHGPGRRGPAAEARGPGQARADHGPGPTPQDRGPDRPPRTPAPNRPPRTPAPDRPPRTPAPGRPPRPRPGPASPAPGPGPASPAPAPVVTDQPLRGPAPSAPPGRWRRTGLPGPRPVRHGPAPEDHGPVRYGPPLPGDGLPVLPELAEALAAAATRAEGDPVGGGPALLEAACGHWRRRGLTCRPGETAAAPGAPALLLALTAALGGDVLVPRPCAAWWVPDARLLGRRVFHVPTTAESGGVPDPYALLETVRRVRAEGGDPRLLVLSVADDPTATVAPPELLHETVEAAAGEGLHLLSDETWRDTLHDPHATVLVSPAEILPERVTVVTDLAGALLPPGWPAAVARFPRPPAGTALPAAVAGRGFTRACSTCSRRSAPASPGRSRPPPRTP